MTSYNTSGDIPSAAAAEPVSPCFSRARCVVLHFFRTVPECVIRVSLRSVVAAGGYLRCGERLLEGGGGENEQRRDAYFLRVLQHGWGKEDTEKAFLRFKRGRDDKRT